MKWIAAWWARRKFCRDYDEARRYDDSFNEGWNLAQRLTLEDTPDYEFSIHISYATECPAFHRGADAYEARIRPVIMRLSQG